MLVWPPLTQVASRWGRGAPVPLARTCRKNAPGFCVRRLRFCDRVGATNGRGETASVPIPALARSRPGPQLPCIEKTQTTDRRRCFDAKIISVSRRMIFVSLRHGAFLLATAIGRAFPLGRTSAGCRRRCRKATVVRDYLFLRQTQVAKYFYRTSW